MGTRGKIPVALYRGREAEDSRRPFTAGARPKIPVALYRGHEARDRRFPCARVLAANEREQFEFELVRAAAGL